MAENITEAEAIVSPERVLSSDRYVHLLEGLQLLEDPDELRLAVCGEVLTEHMDFLQEYARLLGEQTKLIKERAQKAFLEEAVQMREQLDQIKRDSKEVRGNYLKLRSENDKLRERLMKIQGVFAGMLCALPHLTSQEEWKRRIVELGKFMTGGGKEGSARGHVAPRRVAPYHADVAQCRPDHGDDDEGRRRRAAARGAAPRLGVRGRRDRLVPVHQVHDVAAARLRRRARRGPGRAAVPHAAHRERQRDGRAAGGRRQAPRRQGAQLRRLPHRQQGPRLQHVLLVLPGGDAARRGRRRAVAAGRARRQLAVRPLLGERALRERGRQGAAAQVLVEPPVPPALHRQPRGRGLQLHGQRPGLRAQPDAGGARPARGRDAVLRHVPGAARPRLLRDGRVVRRQVRPGPGLHHPPSEPEAAQGAPHQPAGSVHRQRLHGPRAHDALQRVRLPAGPGGRGGAGRPGGQRGARRAAHPPGPLARRLHRERPDAGRRPDALPDALQEPDGLRLLLQLPAHERLRQERRHAPRAAARRAPPAARRQRDLGPQPHRGGAHARGHAAVRGALAGRAARPLPRHGVQRPARHHRRLPADRQLPRPPQLVGRGRVPRRAAQAVVERLRARGLRQDGRQADPGAGPGRGPHGARRPAPLGAGPPQQVHRQQALLKSAGAEWN